MRVDSLIEIGDVIIDEIAKLPIFKYYNLSDYGILASLDGQKIEINKNKQLAEKIKQPSPVAWQHSSFIGNFTSSSNLKPIDIKELIKDAMEYKEEFIAA